MAGIALRILLSAIQPAEQFRDQRDIHRIEPLTRAFEQIEGGRRHHAGREQREARPHEGSQVSQKRRPAVSLFTLLGVDTAMNILYPLRIDGLSERPYLPGSRLLFKERT